MWAWMIGAAAAADHWLVGVGYGVEPISADAGLETLVTRYNETRVLQRGLEGLGGRHGLVVQAQRSLFSHWLLTASIHARQQRDNALGMNSEAGSERQLRFHTNSYSLGTGVAVLLSDDLPILSFGGAIGWAPVALSTRLVQTQDPGRGGWEVLMREHQVAFTIWGEYVGLGIRDTTGGLGLTLRPYYQFRAGKVAFGEALATLNPQTPEGAPTATLNNLGVNLCVSIAFGDSFSGE